MSLVFMTVQVLSKEGEVMLLFIFRWLKSPALARLAVTAAQLNVIPALAVLLRQLDQDRVDNVIRSS